MTDLAGWGAPIADSIAGATRAPAEPRSYLPELADDPAPAARRLVGLHEATTISAAFGALGMAAFVCDGRGLVRAMTPMAKAAVAAGRIRLAGGRLSARRRGDACEIGAAVAAATAAGPDGEPTVRTIVSIAPGESAAPEIIDVIALPRGPVAVLFEPRAIVVLRGAGAGAIMLEPVLARAFGLTTAEAQVAVRLLSGAPRAAIAAERGASLQTVRSQIKNIFAKLNVTRERELVSLLAKIARR